MIYKDGKNVTGVHCFVDGTERNITAIYRGDRLVWLAVRSCYGRGYWINDKPWINTDPWKNNE